MDFTFTSDQLALRDAVRTVLQDVCAPEALRTDTSVQRRKSLCELGFLGVLAPERSGGLGLSDPDFVMLAQEAGYFALPEPLVEQAGIAIPLLAAIDHPRAQQLLADVAAGAQCIAVGQEGALVLGAADADVLILEHSGAVHAVPVTEAALTRQASIDSTRNLATVQFAPSSSTLLADAQTGAALWNSARRRGAVYTAAQLCGLADRMMALAVDYAAQRKQFGKPIGANQAVKHLMANVALRTEFATPVLYAAAAFLPSPTPRAALYAAHAKIAASDAADLASRNAIQVHGAMGYSWEVDLHLYMKRAWALTGAWGDRASHVRRLQAALLDGAIELGPDQTFAA